MVETARAAREITDRTGEASNEAAVTGHQAGDLRDTIVSLNHAVEELRHSVIKVVRTSTADMERRQFQRYAVDLPAALSITGQEESRVQVVDLSEGGGCLRGAADLPPGARGELRLDCLAVPLGFVVRAADSGVMHVAFELDAIAASGLKTLFDRQEVRQAA